MCIKHACTCHKMYTGTTEWTEKCQNQPGRECQVHITQKYDDLFQSGQVFILGNGDIYYWLYRGKVNLRNHSEVE